MLQEETTEVENTKRKIQKLEPMHRIKIQEPMQSKETCHVNDLSVEKLQQVINECVRDEESKTSSEGKKRGRKKLM